MLDEPIPLTTGYPEPVVLHKLSTADADLFAHHVAADLDHLGEHLPWPELAKTPDGARDWLAKYYRREDGRLVVGGAFAGDELLGGALLLQYDERYATVELGVWIVSQAEGKGVATAACRALIELAHGELRAERIEWQVAPENVRSRRLAEKLGFQFEGRLRSTYEYRGRRHDTEVLSLVGDEIAQAVARG
jgi:RimJ/RimL family protein N-acetyltransferase